MALARRLRMFGFVAVLAASTVGIHSLTTTPPAETANAEERHIFLTLTDGQETVTPGGNLTYVVGVRSDDARSRTVDVALSLPSFANVVEASDGGRRDGDKIVWNNFPLDPVVARRLLVSVSVNPYAEVGGTMTAQVTCEGESAADVTTIVGPRSVPVPPELRLRVSDGKAEAVPEEELRYVLTVENVSDRDRTFELRAQLPTSIAFLSATGQYREDLNTVRWTDQVVRAGELRSFEIMAVVQKDVVDFETIVLKASIDGVPAGDITVVQRQPSIRGLSVTVTDGLTSVAPASSVTYQIRLRNDDDRLATDIGVDAALPLYAEFVEASNGGVWTGNNVRWSGLTVSPHGERILTVLAHVRTDAPADAVLRMTAETQGLVGVDQTTVRDGAPERVGPRADAILRKTADRGEVRPGDIVTYTVSLTNTTDHSFRNVSVEDQFDPRFMTVIGAERGQMRDGKMLWLIPELAPGRVWTVRYSVELSAETPHGIGIDNVVTATGEGMETVSLTERVTTARLNVVRGLPPTGAAFDFLFLALTGLAGIGQTLFLKRRIMA